MRLLLYDDTETDAPWLSQVWAVGSRWSGSERVAPVSSWAEALAILVECRDTWAPLPLHVQVWAHGASGASLIAGRALQPAALSAALGGRPLPPGSWLWCRQCDVAQGERGQRYVEALAVAAGCDVLAHTRIVSGVQVSMLGRTVMVPTPWQAGLYALRPTQRAWWPVDDSGGSGPTAPRKVLATTMEPPAWAWQGGAR